LNQVEIRNPIEFNKQNDVGLTGGFGVAFKMGRARISPGFRYTRWSGENDPISALSQANRN
jgi:hypothetical protein